MMRRRFKFKTEAEAEAFKAGVEIVNDSAFYVEEIIPNEPDGWLVDCIDEDADADEVIEDEAPL